MSCCSDEPVPPVEVLDVTPTRSEDTPVLGDHLLGNHPLFEVK